MPPTRLTVRPRKRPDVTILDVAGELTAADEAALFGPLDAALAESAPVLLNLSEITYINSSGISMIIRMLTRCQRAGCSLHAYGLADYFAELLEITRLNQYITLSPDEPTALAALAGPASQSH